MRLLALLSLLAFVAPARAEGPDDAVVEAIAACAMSLQFFQVRNERIEMKRLVRGFQEALQYDFASLKEAHSKNNVEAKFGVDVKFYLDFLFDVGGSGEYRSAAEIAEKDWSTYRDEAKRSSAFCGYQVAKQVSVHPDAVAGQAFTDCVRTATDAIVQLSESREVVSTVSLVGESHFLVSVRWTPSSPAAVQRGSVRISGVTLANAAAEEQGGNKNQILKDAELKAFQSGSGYFRRLNSEQPSLIAVNFDGAPGVEVEAPAVASNTIAKLTNRVEELSEAIELQKDVIAALSSEVKRLAAIVDDQLPVPVPPKPIKVMALQPEVKRAAGVESTDLIPTNLPATAEVHSVYWMPLHNIAALAHCEKLAIDPVGNHLALTAKAIAGANLGIRITVVVLYQE